MLRLVSRMSKLTELLDELCPDGVEYHTLDEVFDTRNGYTPSRSKPEFWVDEGIPWFRMDDIRTNGNVLDDSLEHISPEAVKGTVFPAGTVIVATSATIGEHALLKVPALSNQRFTALIAKPEFAERLLPEFVHYYCFVLDEWCTRNTTQSSFASVDMPRFRKFMFPVPPLEVQQEIVRVLDAFTDLEQSLVSELELRKKQFEEYQLSAFLEAGTDAIGLKRIAEIGTGRLNTNQALEEGPYPFYTRGEEIRRMDEYDFDETAIITAGDGVGVGKTMHFVSGKYALHQRAYRISIVNGAFDSKYIFHLMKATFLPYMIRNSVHASVTSVRKKMLDNFPVPVVDIEVQKKIVSKLDTFEALIDSIEQEISLRRKQYEFYRDELLSFTPKED